MSDVVKGVEFAAKSHQADVKAGKKGVLGFHCQYVFGWRQSPLLLTWL